MLAYIIKRLLLLIPTLFGIMLVNFAIIQFAPGGPIDKAIARLQGTDISAAERYGGGQSGDFSPNNQSAGGDTSLASKYQGARNLDPEIIKRLEKQFGFDRPVHERFFLMLWNYLQFDFGRSYSKDAPVIDLVLQAMPVSISLGLWLTILTYVISIPLGIRKAVSDGSRFDVWTSGVIIVGYAVPGFLLAIALIVFFAGGSFFTWFPLKGLSSENWEELSFFGKIADYFWHLALPLTAMAVGAFATTTFLVKNSFLDEIKKQYVVTARAKGLSERGVLYGHVFRNASLILISGFPGAFLGALFGSSFLIEQIFSLNGLGLLGFDAINDRDYPLMFGTLYIFTLLGLVVQLISDLTYMIIDPRIDFERQEV